VDKGSKVGVLTLSSTKVDSEGSVTLLKHSWLIFGCSCYLEHTKVSTAKLSKVG
jgi:hypothetical protein